MGVDERWEQRTIASNLVDQDYRGSTAASGQSYVFGCVYSDGKLRLANKPGVFVIYTITLVITVQ